MKTTRLQSSYHMACPWLDGLANAAQISNSTCPRPVSSFSLSLILYLIDQNQDTRGPCLWVSWEATCRPPWTQTQRTTQGHFKEAPAMPQWKAAGGTWHRFRLNAAGKRGLENTSGSMWVWRASLWWQKKRRKQTNCNAEMTDLFCET